jgi:hypothetical protein
MQSDEQELKMTATGGTLSGYHVDLLCNTISSIYQYCFGVRLFAPVQTGLGANPASYPLGTGRGIGMTTCPHTAPWLKKE